MISEILFRIKFFNIECYRMIELLILDTIQIFPKYFVNT